MIYNNIPLARLYERTSKRGNTYLTGRCGLAQITVVRTDETSEHGQAIWMLKISEPAPRADARDVQKPLDQDIEAAKQRSFARTIDDDIPF